VNAEGRWGRRARRAVVAAFLLAAVWLIVAPAMLVDAQTRSDARYTVRGMVLKVDVANRVFYVSHDRIEGLMDAMTMPFEVRDAAELRALVPGAIVEFALVVSSTAGYATDIRVRRYESAEQDPLTARRLSILERATGRVPSPVAIGQRVPDFELIDQARRPVTLSSFAGKVVALNFIYTRCALPQFCLRVSNTFGVLQKRFTPYLGKDLVLLTVTFDPERDTPEVLAAYAAQWNANPAVWRFLTGPVSDVRRVCAMFGVEFFPDEGLMNHSVRSAIVDRTGRLAANVEGNQFTPEQFGDLLRSVVEP
jgi:protein SCO1/2